MKKIIGLIVFVVALVWTWNVINSPSAVSYETHIGIQTNFSQLLKSTVEQKRPTAKNITITKIYTETMDDNKVKAIFAYNYTEGDGASGQVLQNIEGESVLHRDPQAAADDDRWLVQSIKTTGDSITFEDGIVIGAGASEPEPEAETPTDSSEVLPDQDLTPAKK